MRNRSGRRHTLTSIFTPRTGTILDRCKEILVALYSEQTRDEKNWCSDPERLAGARRVIRRLRLSATIGPRCAQRRTPEEVNEALSCRTIAHLFKHARACCTASHPNCAECPLVSFCPTGITRAAMPRRKPTAIDLCAGAGSLSAAFRREGFHVVLAVESDRNAAQSYRVNNPGVPVLEADVRDIRTPHVLRAMGVPHGLVTAVIAGPPCQGFSAAGPRKPRASRNFLFRSIAKIAQSIQANSVLMENVPGLRHVNGVSFEKRILKCFSEFGYRSDFVEVDASKFGVPQRRHRLIFVGARAVNLPSFRLRTTSRRSAPTVRRALRGIPRPYYGRTRRSLAAKKPFHNHRAMIHSPRVIRRIKQIKPGEGPISYRRLRLDLAGTLIAGHRALPVHPRQDRTITVREAARLQTLPDNFRFLGPHAEQPLQVANVVPYRLARALARALSALSRSTARSSD